jgi:hypothetical protein
MSVSHNHRRKTIRQMKKKYGSKWQPHFRAHADAITRANDGPLIGTLADIIDAQKISPDGGLAEVAVAASVSP